MNEEQMVQRLIDDAARFRETMSVFQSWLGQHHLFLIDKGQEWLVLQEDPQWIGKWTDKRSFPTYAQALKFALDQVHA